MTEFNPITIAKDRQQVLSKLLEMNWSELQTLEYAGFLLFPHTIVKTRAGGVKEYINVMLRVPREPQVRKARLAAREWAKSCKLDPVLDPDLFDNMDTICLLADCIRNVTPPHEPWVMTPQELEENYDRPSLDATWARLEALRKVIDPQSSIIDDELFAAMVGIVAKKSAIDPLAVLDSDGQTNFIVLMAKRLQPFLASK